MTTSPLPNWQLPSGVSRGTWDYAHSAHIADEYDDYFAENRLFELDQQILANHFTPPGTVADLGCGSGRALVPLVRRGLSGLAVDLSEDMLRVVARKAEEEQLDIRCLKANLVELNEIDDNAVDYAMCMFSTLGMVRGGGCRQQALDHVRRIVKPGGKFVIHVHNWWYNLYDPGGPWWLLGNMFHSLLDRQIERGDKFFEYRGIPNMYLHVFTRREIRRALRRAGFRIIEWTPLDPRRHRELRTKWFAESLRANGWIIACT